MLDCLRLLHYHLGSQVSNIRDIRRGAMEGARFYVGLVQEGAPMGYLDLGGGLAVDYDGSHTNYFVLVEHRYQICRRIILACIQVNMKNRIDLPVNFHL